MQTAPCVDIASLGRLRSAPTIRHAEIDGCRVILDLGTERYSVLDEVASGMWSAITTDGRPVDRVDLLASRFDVERSRVEADFSSFIDVCVAQGLLVPFAEAPPAEPMAVRIDRPKKPTVIGGLRMLLSTQRSLAQEGFRTTYERISLLPAGTDSSALPRALSKFLMAENLFIPRKAPADCLLRSLSLYRFLQSCNIPATHRIGVDRFPFQAHAWVEHDGIALLDDRGRELKLTPLASIGAVV